MEAGNLLFDCLTFTRREEPAHHLEGHGRVNVHTGAADTKRSHVCIHRVKCMQDPSSLQQQEKASERCHRSWDNTRGTFEGIWPLEPKWQHRIPRFILLVLRALVVTLFPSESSDWFIPHSILRVIYLLLLPPEQLGALDQAFLDVTWRSGPTIKQQYLQKQKCSDRATGCPHL